MDYRAVNLQEKLDAFSDHWAPKIIARMNDYHFKVVKIQGDFVWHSHAETDEVFLALDGEMAIDFRDGRVELRAGEMFVVPRGVEHKPFAARECRLMVVEPAGTINTGDAGGDMTAEDNVWI
ncbi:MAG: cupin domain-containing protein [Deltaproteobacteria bacterium]|nr:cupin domain-containing protein [Deltaproteobacteria bacterium]